MTTLTMTTYSMPGANLGEENPHPDFKNVSYIHAGYRCTERVTPEEMRHIGKGMIKTILPYTILDNYDRSRSIRTFPAVVLENGFLKATFLPTLGGRLWSLYDKQLNKELLYVNSVFQPANLAIRNAWFSGGVEWNVGIKGHNPYTCDPLFVETALSKGNVPLLRMYEFERIRGIVYSIEAYLPPDESVLYIRNTIENTSPKETYAYWWSNIAVAETAATRVIVPATEAFLCQYNEGSYVLDKTAVPYINGVDCSYPYNSRRSLDYFYKIPASSPKWIAAVEPDGTGLIQFSQSKLPGRKMFLWGQGAGGRHWGEFLSSPGESYIEIQAGLTHTQLEHLPMKGGETWQWIEGYCSASCPPEKIAGPWQTACDTIAASISNHVDLNSLDLCLEQKFPTTLKNRQILRHGSGWGYLEEKARAHMGKPPLSKLYCFPKQSLTEKQRPWLTLLEKGEFPCPDPAAAPVGYLVCPDWLPLAKQAAICSNNWYGWLQLGIMYYANGYISDAHNALELSLSCEENAWAYRNLAMIFQNDKQDPSTAVSLILKAQSLAPDDRGLLVNCAQILTAAEKYETWLELFDTLQPHQKADSRLLFYRALAFIRTGRADLAAQIITPDFVLCDIKEGEASLSHLWFEMYRQLTAEENHPLPYSLDFRMHE